MSEKGQELLRALIEAVREMASSVSEQRASNFALLSHLRSINGRPASRALKEYEHRRSLDWKCHVCGTWRETFEALLHHQHYVHPAEAGEWAAPGGECPCRGCSPKWRKTVEMRELANLVDDDEEEQTGDGEQGQGGLF